jgi:septum formation protein
MSLVLASASPRRSLLLERLGLEFEVLGATGDGPAWSVDPAERVLAHARFKAREVAVARPQSWILAADTLVHGDGGFFPKPRDRQHAASMLARLVEMGEHQVWTGSCLLDPEGHCRERADVATVAFRGIPAARLEAYLAGTEWRDKAGAYGIQGWAGDYTELLEGDFDTVVGLSASAVFRLFADAGLPPEAFRR